MEVDGAGLRFLNVPMFLVLPVFQFWKIKNDSLDENNYHFLVSINWNVLWSEIFYGHINDSTILLRELVINYGIPVSRICLLMV